MIWALHPLQTETVIYATQRTELMMAFFYLATLYCSLRYWSDLPRERPVRMLQSAPRSALANACRPRLPRRHGLKRSHGLRAAHRAAVRSSIHLRFARRRTAQILAVVRRDSPQPGFCSWSSPSGSPHGGAAGFDLGPPVYVWWFTQAKILWLYLKLAIWPSPLLIHYQLPYVTTPLEACLYVVPLLLLGIGTLVLLWRNHPVGFLGTCVFAILSPTFVIPVVTEMAAERRMYLPLAALVVLFVVGGYQLAQSIMVRRQGECASCPRIPTIYDCDPDARRRNRLWPRQREAT